MWIDVSQCSSKLSLYQTIYTTIINCLLILQNSIVTASSCVFQGPRLKQSGMSKNYWRPWKKPGSEPSSRARALRPVWVKVERQIQSSRRTPSQPLWGCRLCEFLTFRLDKFLKHIWTGHPIMAVLCLTCDVISQIQMLNLYAKSNKYYPPCPICSELLSRGQRLGKPWPCQLCIVCEKKVFSTGRQFALHLEQEHKALIYHATTTIPSMLRQLEKCVSRIG